MQNNLLLIFVFAISFLLFFKLLDAKTLVGLIAAFIVLISPAIIYIIKTEIIIKKFYKVSDVYKKFNIINVENSEKVKELYNHSALSYSYIPDKAFLNFIYNWLIFENVLKDDNNINIYLFTGKLLKDTFNIIGYEDDIPILSIDLIDLDLSNPENSNNFYKHYIITYGRYLDDMVNSCYKRIDRLK